MWTITKDRIGRNLNLFNTYFVLENLNHWCGLLFHQKMPGMNCTRCLPSHKNEVMGVCKLKLFYFECATKDFSNVLLKKKNQKTTHIVLVIISQ